MSSPDESSQLKAGHPPAVKAGGMRITQHKIPHTKDGKELPNEDLTGLSGPSPVPTNPISIAGAPNRGNADFTPQAAKVAHSPKPPAIINIKPNPNIQQPRK
ncbi:death-associated protein 1 [Nymphalis io]|uniref:Death-associated protein 1 n=1 Tax=Vanessa tameamea TaxID=334116 RepID=A0A8B8IKR1_VANTA|nr:death-associated protein 1 [Vanessa tameamea]XP_046973522.1 death-associated protein 1 [Vanessa cardui]XP_047540393.1 death-associated protein 1 [Vanessa atalanta]XP_050356394.1 death-associated protein 1 [Nymphalis io]